EMIRSGPSGASAKIRCADRPSRLGSAREHHPARVAAIHGRSWEPDGAGPRHGRSLWVGPVAVGAAAVAAASFAGAIAPHGPAFVVMAMVAFGVARNLPFVPFSGLAPLG